MSVILAIDTSATPVSCALLQEGRVLASDFAHTGMTHSQTLVPMVEHILKTTDLKITQVDAIAVNSGPGSFTGVRIGVATVKGLAFAHDIPCISVSTLESMAYNIMGLPSDAVIACVMDARCRQVYAATFSLNNGKIARLSPDEAISIEELKNRLKNVENSVILVGDGADLCYNSMRDELENIHLAPLALRYQNAVSTAVVAAEKLAAGETIEAQALQPVYLRLPQAERELRQRQQSVTQKQ